jgi:hypothetical protein
MTYSTYDADDFALPLPITSVAQTAAQTFSSKQLSPTKQEQVRLNTLAVYVVNDYLQLMGIATNLASSEVRNPIVQLGANVADLEVVGLGRLECRSVQRQEQLCYMPPETWHDRIGYVIVQIDELARQAMMLGFSPTANIEFFPLTRLRPPEALVEHLYELTQLPKERSPTLVHLSQWFQNTFEAGWQAIEAVLNPAELGFAYRSYRWAGDSHDSIDISRAKLIDLGLQLLNQPLALTVELDQRPEELDIRLRLYTTTGQFLPPDVRLIVLDETGAIFLEATARNADNYLQLQFSGISGEHFSVQISLGEAQVIEEFVI